jgi:hypothetical protein
VISLFKRGPRRIQFRFHRLIAPPPLRAAWKMDGW